MKFSITDFFSKCEQIRRELRIWSDLLKKSIMENFIFCAVQTGEIGEKPNFGPNFVTFDQNLTLFPFCHEFYI